MSVCVRMYGGRMCVHAYMRVLPKIFLSLFDQFKSFSSKFSNFTKYSNEFQELFTCHKYLNPNVTASIFRESNEKSACRI